MFQNLTKSTIILNLNTSKKWIVTVFKQFPTWVKKIMAEILILYRKLPSMFKQHIVYEKQY